MRNVERRTPWQHDRICQHFSSLTLHGDDAGLIAKRKAKLPEEFPVEPFHLIFGLVHDSFVELEQRALERFPIVDATDLEMVLFAFTLCLVKLMTVAGAHRVGQLLHVVVGQIQTAGRQARDSEVPAATQPIGDARFRRAHFLEADQACSLAGGKPLRLSVKARQQRRRVFSGSHPETRLPERDGQPAEDDRDAKQVGA